MKVKFEERKKELEKEFEQLSQERQKLVEQRKVLDQKLSEIQVRQVQLQGAYSELNKLMNGEAEDGFLEKKDKK